MKKQDIGAIVFDLGNVLIEVNFELALEYWSSLANSVDSMQLANFLQSKHHIQFEQGQTSPEIFFKHLKHDLPLTLNLEQLKVGWNKVLVKEFTGIRSLLEQCHKHVPLFCFSNTNVVHHHLWQEKFESLLTYFKDIFVSYELQLRKPDAKAFKAVIERIGVQAQRIVFFDDNDDNVETAKRMGMQAQQVNQIEEMKIFLTDFMP